MGNLFAITNRPAGAAKFYRLISRGSGGLTSFSPSANLNALLIAVRSRTSLVGICFY
jgi:hypothetical protein